MIYASIDAVYLVALMRICLWEALCLCLEACNIVVAELLTVLFVRLFSLLLKLCQNREFKNT